MRISLPRELGRIPTPTFDWGSPVRAPAAVRCGSWAPRGPLASENYRNKKPRAVWADAGLTGASLDGEIDVGQEKNWRREPLFRVASLKLGPNPYIVASVMSGAKQCDDRPYSEAVYNRGAAAVGKSLLEPKRRCSPLATGSDLLPPILASLSGEATIRDPELHTGGLSRPRAHCSSNS
jgi:hypothetical protein